MVAALASHGRSRWSEPNHAHFELADFAVGAAGDGVDQVAQRPGQAVQLPDDQQVALVQDLLKRWVGRCERRCDLGEDPVAVGALEGVDLQMGCWSVMETRA
jgi:hypothetical protein